MQIYLSRFGHCSIDLLSRKLSLLVHQTYSSFCEKDKYFYGSKIRKFLMHILQHKSTAPHPLLYYILSGLHESTTNLPSLLRESQKMDISL